jgi:hypothetical protein
MQIAAQEINPEHGHKIQHLKRLVGDEQYAASLLKVKSIMEYDTVTEVLRTWEWIREMSRSDHRSAGKNSHGYTPKKTNGSALEPNFNRF